MHLIDCINPTGPAPRLPNHLRVRVNRKLHLPVILDLFLFSYAKNVASCEKVDDFYNRTFVKNHNISNDNTTIRQIVYQCL
jgi:hypothetical protein